MGVRELRQGGASRHRVRLLRCAASGKVRFRDKTEVVHALHSAATARHFASIEGQVSRSPIVAHMRNSASLRNGDDVVARQQPSQC